LLKDELGVIETDFPDLWSKVVISSETEGTILCIPRERNMTRLYIELPSHTSVSFASSPERSTQDFVISRAQAIVDPFSLSWKSIEWFGVYTVSQRISKHFSTPSNHILIAGDAAHTHSPKAGQGMNVSMHDAFNLAWKLNLVLRNLAPPLLLDTYASERRKIAQDLIDFDEGHAKAFLKSDPKALAENFAENINFISGFGAAYRENVLNLPNQKSKVGLKAGSLLTPVRVERYIDANPVSLQLDIPMLGQFRILFFTPDPKIAKPFLTTICEEITSSRTLLGCASVAAQKSYAEMGRRECEIDEYIQPQRYTAVSQLYTLGLITTAPRIEVEIADLPPAFQDSRWTFYLDNIMEEPSCTEKWVGELVKDVVACVCVRPDGYVGCIERWDVVGGNEAVRWLNAYFGGFLRG